MDGYRDWLLELGYAPASVTHSLALGHMRRWMDRHDVVLEQLNRDLFGAFA